MRQFNEAQKDAIMGKLHDPSCKVFVSYDNGISWVCRGDCSKPNNFSIESDVDDSFFFDQFALYVTVRKENEEVARECLIEGKVIEVSDRCHFVVTKENIFDYKEHWMAFLSSDAEFTIKKDPIVMWVAATADSCSKPHNSCSELAKKLSLEHDGEITDGQVVGGFTFNMIKVEL